MSNSKVSGHNLLRTSRAPRQRRGRKVEMKRTGLFPALIGLGILALVAACGGGDEGPATTVERGLPARAAGQAQASGGAPTSDIAVSGSGLSYYPLSGPVQLIENALTVEGYGMASATADQSILYFFISSDGVLEKPVPLPACVPGTNVECPSPGIDIAQQPEPITEDLLQPFVDAIKSQGVSEDDIKIELSPIYYGNEIVPANATITALVKNISKTDAVVQAVQQADVSVAAVSVQYVNVSYALSDCAGLEDQAMAAAVQDTRERASQLANTLGLEIGKVVAAAQSSSPAGAFGCGTNEVGILERAFPVGARELTTQAQEVSISSTVWLAFAIK